MAGAAIFNETGLKTRFDTGDDCFVNVAFSLLFTGCFNVEVDQFLTIYDGDAEFFRLRRVK